MNRTEENRGNRFLRCCLQEAFIKIIKIIFYLNRLTLSTETAVINRGPVHIVKNFTIIMYEVNAVIFHCWLRI